MLRNELAQELESVLHEMLCHLDLRCARIAGDALPNRFRRQRDNLKSELRRPLPQLVADDIEQVRPLRRQVERLLDRNNVGLMLLDGCQHDSPGLTDHVVRALSVSERAHAKVLELVSAQDHEAHFLRARVDADDGLVFHAE